MTSGKFQTLYERALSAPEIKSVFEYFLDYFGAEPKFLAMGSIASLAHRERFAEMARTVMGVPPDAPAQSGVMFVPKYRFFHGPMMIGDYHATILTWEDRDIVLLQWMKLDDMASSQFARLRVKLVPAAGAAPQEPPVPSVN